MGLESLGDAGIGIVAAVLIIREVMSFLAKREDAAAKVAGASDDDCDEAMVKLTRVETQMASLVASSQQMATILSRTDESGAPMVYTPRSLTAAITALGRTETKLISAVERLTDKVERLR